MIKDQFSYYEQIDAYLSGQMSAEDRVSFEKQIESDIELKEEVSVQKDLRDLVIGASLQNVRSMMDKDLEVLDNKNSFKKPLTFLLAFLSVATIGLVSYHYMSEDKIQDNKITETYKEPKKGKVSAKETSDNQKSISKTDHSNEQPIIPQEESTRVLEEENNREEDETVPYNPLVEGDSVTKEDTDTIQLEEKKEVLLTEEKTEEAINDFEESETPIPLNFSGKLTSVKSEYDKQNGQIIIEGEVIGGVKPYIYLVNEEEFLDYENISQLEPGTYTVKVVDATSKTIDLGEIEVEEEICVLDYNESFVLAFDNNWKIPVIEDRSFSFTVYSQKGMVYQHDFDLGETSVWNGINNKGSKSESGFYRFEIVYSNVERCFG